MIRKAASKHARMGGKFTAELARGNLQEPETKRKTEIRGWSDLSLVLEKKHHH